MQVRTGRFRRLPWLAALALITLSALAQAQPRVYTVRSPDGTDIAVQEAGDPTGRPIIFIHGLLGNHLSWERQVDATELQRFRLITFDLRGHGWSGHPDDSQAYEDGRRWAEDLAAVVRASRADQPVVVGWSLGAAVISNYLATFGDKHLAGAVYVGGVIELEPELLVPQPQVYSGMASSDLRTHLDAERAFLRLCFATQPDEATFQRLAAGAAMASGPMQRAVHGMTLDAARGLGSMTKPMLLVYGTHDALVQAKPSYERAKRMNRQLRVEFYEESGHSPFMEESRRFNQDLSDFVDSTAQP